MTAIRVNVSNPILKAKANPNSRRYAINAKCADCMGCTAESMEAGFRKNIKECTSTSCSLHSFRPYQDGDDDQVEVLELVEMA